MNTPAVDWKRCYEESVVETEQLEAEARSRDNLIGELRGRLEEIRDGKNLWTIVGARSLVEAFLVLEELEA